MKTRILAAALVAPIIALGPATAWAHHCSRHPHHARGVEKQKYGSSRQMQKNDGANQDLNQGTGQAPGAGQGGSSDQGVGGSSGTSGKRQGI